MPEGDKSPFGTLGRAQYEVMLKLRDLASYEMPKKILFLEKDFSIESGELTPKLSVKRRVVEEHYRDRIDQLYQEAERAQPEDAKAES